MGRSRLPYVTSTILFVTCNVLFLTYNHPAREILPLVGVYQATVREVELERNAATSNDESRSINPMRAADAQPKIGIEATTPSPSLSRSTPTPSLAPSVPTPTPTSMSDERLESSDMNQKSHPTRNDKPLESSDVNQKRHPITPAAVTSDAVVSTGATRHTDEPIHHKNDYIGCYLDKKDDRIMVFLKRDIGISDCRSLCAKYFYAYAGLQNGKECFCGNEYDLHGPKPENECDMECTTGSGGICGGVYRMDVFWSSPQTIQRQDIKDPPPTSTIEKIFQQSASAPSLPTHQLFDSIGNTSNTCHIRNLPSGDIPKIFEKSTYVFGPSGWYSGYDQDHDQPIEHLHNKLVGNHFYPLSDYDHLQNPGGVTLFQNAFVGGANPMVFDCHVTYFPGGCIYHHPLKPHYNISETKTFFPLQRLVQSRLQFEKLKGSYENLTDLIHLDEGTVVMLAASHSNNVYHSLIENLLRLVQVAEFLQQHSSSKQQESKVIILAQGQILMKDNAHKTFFNPILGLQPNNIPWRHYNTHQKVYHIRRLLIPTPTHCGVANPTMVQKFQDMFTNALQEKRLVLPPTLPLLPNITTTTHKQKNMELILIHKRDKRGFINYSEFLQALKDRFQKQQKNTDGDNNRHHNYQILEYTGRESMAMAASLHRNARIIIGPHGAGFSNLIYCQRNYTGVVEIHSSIGNGHTMAWAASHPRAKGPHSGKRGSSNKCHQFTAHAAGLPTRFIQMKNNASTEFNESFLIEDIPLVLDTIQELLQQVLQYQGTNMGPPSAATPKKTFQQQSASSAQSPPTPSYNFTTAICTIMKDAEAYLEEWIDYHLLGMEFDNIYIYDNSVDFDLRHWYQNTRDDPVYSRVQVTHYPMKRQQERPMNECIQRFGQNENGPKHDYIAHIDADEFFVIPGYPNTYTNIKGVLQDYLVPYGGALSVNWMMVGTNHKSVYSPLPVTKRFQYREEEPNVVIKTIVKSSDFKGMRNPHSAFLREGSSPHTTLRPGYVFKSSTPSQAADPRPATKILLLYHFRYTSEKEYLSKRCVRGGIIESWCTKDGKLKTNGPEHIQPHPGTVFDNKPWQMLTSKVPKYKMYEKFRDFH